MRRVEQNSLSKGKKKKKTLAKSEIAKQNTMAAADRDALLSWSRAFVQAHGRRPTRADMPEDVGERRREGERD